jgi:excisionase family DNA binding protein
VTADVRIDRVSAAIAELTDALRAEVRAELASRRDEAPAVLRDVPEAARALGVSRTTLYGLLDRPDGLRTIRVGRRRLIARAAVEAFATEAAE